MRPFLRRSRIRTGLNRKCSSLKSFSHAVGQLGGTAGGALNDLENFASKLRSNPQGYAAFLKSVGVEARDAQGNIRGAAELYKEFRKNVGERKPYEQQLLYAQEMGVSEQTWRATDPAKHAAEEAAQRAKYARMGYDPDKTADGAKNLQHALRDMFDSIGIVGEKTAAKIFADIGDNLKGFTTFIEQHGDEIAEILSKVAQVVLEVSKALLQLLTSPEVKRGFDWMLGMFGHVEEGTGKWTADTEKIKGALEALATFVATVFVAKIVGGIREIVKELAPLLAMLAPFAGVLGLPALGTAVIGGALVAGSDPSKGVTHGGRPDGALNPGDELPGAGGGSANGGGEGAWARMKRLGRAALGAVGIGGGESDSRQSPVAANKSLEAGARESYDFWRSKGLTHAQAAGLVGMEQGESNFNPRSIGDGGAAHGAFQHHPDRRAAILRGTGINIDKATHQQQLEAAWWELNNTHKHALRAIQAAETPSAAAAAGVRHFEVPGNIPKESILRGGYAEGWAKQFAPASASSDQAPASTTARKPGWIDKDTFTDGLNTFKRGEDGHLKRVTNLPGQPATLTDKAKELVGRVNEGVGRLDAPKLRGIGAATEGFNPSEYMKAPPVGSSTSNDNSVRHQSYNRGDTNVTIHTTADARETHDLWRRHEDRQKADDLRHASNIFAA